MKVSLIRHGRPSANFTTRITGRQFAAWLAAYDRAGLDSALPPPATLVASLADCRLLLASPTRRALASAHLLALTLGSGLAPDLAPDAVEAPLPTSVFWPFPAQPATLTVIARVLWHLRLAQTQETIADIRTRARRLAGQLTARSVESGPVALVGHGYMHLFTRRALQTLGWKQLHADGHGYWSCSRFGK